MVMFQDIRLASGYGFVVSIQPYLVCGPYSTESDRDRAKRSYKDAYLSTSINRSRILSTFPVISLGDNGNSESGD